MVEGKNRTLEDIARTMLCASRPPLSFWTEAVNTENYVLNRYLIRPILKKTPHELPKIENHISPIFIHLDVNVSFATMEKAG